MKRAPLIIAAFLFVAAISGAQAATVSLVAHLLGSGMVPVTDSDAFAEAQFSYDSATHALQYYVNYDGVAPSKVDLHGPAAATDKAASVLDIPVSESPISGKLQLTPAEENELLAGKMYLDVHSQKYPAGEIRGQIVRQ
ncbi:MAG TPA: CHRD domain-containing protein [Rhizomicrobium sp.]|nr:CHRD domain-containing protein [Rhizomicrobium sp.]